MKLIPYLSPCMKLNALWMKNFGTGRETLGLLEEKVDPNLHHVHQGSDFLNKTPKAQEGK